MRTVSASLISFLILLVVVPAQATTPAQEAQAITTAAVEENTDRVFTIGLAGSYHRNVGVPKDKQFAHMGLGGIMWRARLLDWVQLGGGFFVGADMGDFGTDASSLRFELLSGQFELPASKWIHPTIRVGFGWQTETFQNKRFGETALEADLPYHGEGMFLVGGPGVVIFPIEWMQVHAELQSTVFARGEPDGSPALQLGFEIGVGFIF